MQTSVIKTQTPFKNDYERNGKLIVVEGIDGAGKTTQIDVIYDYLKKEGLDVVKFREPGGTEVGEKIRGILLRGGLHPYTELLLFTSARMELIQKKIIPALEEGKIVLLDRFIYSTRAYQGGGREIPNEAAMMTTELFDHVLPDHIIYLHIPMETVVERRKQRFGGETLDTFEKESSTFQERLMQSFEDDFDGLSFMDSNIVVRIDATQSIEKVSTEVKAWLDKNILP